MSDLDGDVEQARRQARAVERLRRRRSYHCPHCGYQGSRMDCPRCGEVCEFESWRPRSRHL